MSHKFKRGDRVWINLYKNILMSIEPFKEYEKSNVFTILSKHNSLKLYAVEINTKYYDLIIDKGSCASYYELTEKDIGKRIVLVCEEAMKLFTEKEKCKICYEL